MCVDCEMKQAPADQTSRGSCGDGGDPGGDDGGDSRRQPCATPSTAKSGNAQGSSDQPSGIRSNRGNKGCNEEVLALCGHCEAPVCCQHAEKSFHLNCNYFICQECVAADRNCNPYDATEGDLGASGAEEQYEGSQETVTLMVFGFAKKTEAIKMPIMVSIESLYQNVGARVGILADELYLYQGNRLLQRNSTVWLSKLEHGMIVKGTRKLRGGSRANATVNLEELETSGDE